MAIRSIEDGKTMRQYCARLGRKGVAERIIEIAKTIGNGNDEYMDTIKAAGMIRALAMGCKWDCYWDEKQHIGFYKMIHEAEYSNKTNEVKRT